MSELIPHVLKLKALREHMPQFLFYGGITYTSMVKVRSKVFEFKEQNPNINEIDFILYSLGGSADDAYRIIRTLRNNFETVNVIIPFWAKSAGTLLALGGSKVIMDEYGEFGPLDAQIGKERDDSPEYDSESALNDEFSLNRIEQRYKILFADMFEHLYTGMQIRLHKQELTKLLLEHTSKFYEPLLKQIDPYRLGEKRRALDIGANYAQKILAQFNPTVPKIEEFVDYLVNRCPDHGYIVDYNILSIYLEGLVFKSTHFGDKYAKALSELSGVMISKISQLPTYIDFVIADLSTNDKNAAKNTILQELANELEAPKKVMENFDGNENEQKLDGSSKELKIIIQNN